MPGRNGLNMIGTIQVKISAHSPQMPLCPVFAFQDSYQNVRICDVPKKIGDWSIKRVEVECQFPDNKVGKFDCSLIGGVWATTISACSTAGTTTNGFVVNGYDENNNKYILGKSDLYILTNDSRIVPQKELTVVNILPSKPQTPHVGDAVFVEGKFEVYDGANWISTGMDDVVIEGIENKIPTKLSQLQNDAGYSKVTESGVNTGYAEYSDYALRAEHADTADYASTANSAGRADTAGYADSAFVASKVLWENVEGKPDLATTEYVDNAIGNVLTQEVF